MSETEASAMLLGRLREALQEHLAQPLHDLFDELDAHLFDLAERSRNSVQAELYFDALRLLRSERVQVETGFLEATDVTLNPSLPADGAERPSGPLRLVDKDELEETLTLENLVQRLSERLARPLQLLLTRLARLTGTSAPERPQDSAISPRGLSRLFRAALAPVGFHVEIRLIAFGLFGQHVLRSLAALYSRLNRILAEGGILPELSESDSSPQLRAVRSARRSARHRIPEPGSLAPAAAQPAPPPGTVPDGYDERLGELHRLLRAREATTSDPAEHGDSSTAQPLDVTAIDLALDRLWTFEGDPLAFKAYLVTSARRVSGQDAATLTREHEDTVDLVSLLFARVRTDRNLPPSIRHLLVRLHVPFLRTALRDPSLLHAPSHPARELLDELAGATIGWCSSADAGEALLKQVALIVEKLASHHESDQPIEFSAAVETLRQHVEAHLRRADLVEQRTVETVLGRERLSLARNRVAALLEQVLEQHEPIPWVRQLLRGPWSNHLALLWLRQSETSAAFREALAFAEELVWADDPNASRTDPLRLERARDTLPEMLRQGLAGVTLYDSEIVSLTVRLREFLDIQMRGDEPPDVLYEIDPSLAQADFRNQWRESLEETRASHPERDPDADLSAHVGALPNDSWVEFSPDAGGEDDPDRGKLCWTSPYTGQSLFVNRNGTRLREYTPEALAAEIQSGRAFLIDGGRLLERTLRSLVDELQQAVELPSRLSSND